MSEKAHEVEALILAMFAAVPLYATQTISLAPLLVYHAVMLAITCSVAVGKGPEIIPAKVMRTLAIAYVGFYVLDAAIISRSAIAASTHLVLFIAAYQPVEALRTRNDAQRLLTTSLIFTASVATATHVTIVPFVIAFAFLLFRQLMHLAHRDTASAVGNGDPSSFPAEPPSSRAAAFYLGGTTLVAFLLFPLLPRVRNPIVPGLIGSLSNASTGLSETINLNQQRTITPDTTVVSRVLMGRETVPFFTPLRLRGAVYDRFRNNEWLQSRREFLPLEVRGSSTFIAQPAGFRRSATLQQRLIVGSRLFLPVGTYEIDGLQQVYEGPTRDVYMTGATRGEMVTYDVRMAREVTPLRIRHVPVTNYAVTPAVAAMARRIVGKHSDPMMQAADIEHYLSTRFTYVPDPSQIGRRRMTVDDFLLREQRGHCEYFAAGMVALMSALGTPARIVGGFYGGKLNPLTGWFLVRREDAHAWVEVFDGGAWRTFDPTPPSLRPGNAQSGLLSVYAAALSDSINFFWDRYILTFGLADQVALALDAIRQTRDSLEALRRGAKHSVAQLLTVRYAIAVAIVAAIGALLLLFVWSRRPPFDLLSEHLARLGIEVGAAMTMEEALHELRRTRPMDADALAPLIALYEAERFSATPPEAVREAIRSRLRTIARSA